MQEDNHFRFGGEIGAQDSQRDYHNQTRSTHSSATIDGCACRIPQYRLAPEDTVDSGEDKLKITRIFANNFRTLENFDLSMDHNYCAISGKNNCGKSAILRVVQHFLMKTRDDPFSFQDESIGYSQDLTKWVSGGEAKISIGISLQISDEKDAELFFVVNTYASDSVTGKEIKLDLTREVSSDGNSKLTCVVNGEAVEERGASEILKKLRTSNSMIFHNSVNPGRSFFFGGQGLLEVVEAYFSAEDRDKIEAAQKTLQARIKSATKQHKGEIDKLLGKLQDKYQVELATVDRGKSSSFSLEVKLADKSVDVPLKDWGAGTQNRTRLLMTILDAIRKKSHLDAQERLTPVILVEEPESFLHPSAQSDFGQVLAALAEEHDIQIIATTHSPYMLNVKQPSANVLLDRKLFRGALRETCVVPIMGDKWMLPFARILGVMPEDFTDWAQIFGAKKDTVVLVEGAIDVDYFNFFKKNHPEVYQLDDSVEILPYNGKDALKNTQVLKFMMSRLARAFITFDLDAKEEVQKKLEAIELVEGRDFCSIGRNDAGGGCIEGLVPKSIKSKVYAENVELVQALTSAVTKEKNEARDRLKSLLLQETMRSGVQSKEFQEFKKLFGVIDRALKAKPD